MTQVRIAPAPVRAAGSASALIALAAVAVALGISFQDSIRSVVSVWNSESFAHGWIVPPISAWLIWRRRADLARCAIVPFWPAVAGLLACGGAWLVGRLAGVNTIEQFAIVGMLQCAFALVLGWQAYKTVAFPLLFLFFAVPFGQFLQPPLMELTADFTVAAIQLTGIPIVREGLHFQLPTGRWSVVEACSGLRYLLAAIPIACIYSYLTYRSAIVRTLFIATVVAVAVLANWIRAYMIVMIGHLSGMTLAVGVDHIIYGWVFFGIVMALSFWIGSFWEDPPEHALRRAPGESPTSRSEARVASAATLVAAGLLGIVGVSTWPLAAEQLFSMGHPTIAMPALSSVVAQAPIPEGNFAYRPMYEGGLDRYFGHSIAEPKVGVYVAHYLHQHRNGEMITWGNRVVPAGPEDLTWRIIDTLRTEPSRMGARFPGSSVNEYVVDGPSGRYVVWEWFWVNGRELTDPKSIKMNTALDLLRGRGDESLAWFVWTTMEGGRDAARTRLVAAANGLQSGARLARLQ